MSCLYVNEQGATIGIDAGRVYVKYKGGMEKYIPVATLEAITIFGNVSITSACIAECLKRGISVDYFSTNGSYYGKLVSTRHTNVFRLKQQISRFEDESFSLQLAKKIIKAKVSNQIVVAKRYCKNSLESEKEITNMKLLKAKIDFSESISQLMGYEGNAAKSYFSALSNIINPNFSFNGRNRQPPKDKFNSMISLGYTLLMYDIYNEIENHFLNPYVGFMHADSERHPTLASDLMEEWRAILIDSMVLSLIQGNEILPEHFINGEDGGVYLTRDGMKIFIKKFETKMKVETNYLSYVDYRTSFRRALSLQTGQIVKCIEENSTDYYEPVYIR